MQVYISADMEGVTGLVGAQDVQAGGQDYQHGPIPQLHRLFGVFMRVASALTDQQPYC
ncbi:M55 family metallopeptidase [Streptomyces fagopyri]|uniref:M55 family metallopeptidase n=1 Tax=Streptomyces fagopyri TaxID=2662397 RepID=UPI00382165CA